MNIICPYRDCQQRIEVCPEDAGTQADCPACARPLRVPELLAFPPEEVANMELGGGPKFDSRLRLDGPSVLDPPEFQRRPQSAPPAGSAPACPECSKALDAKARQVVLQLVELHQTGAVVNGLCVECGACGREVRFHDILWVDERVTMPNGAHEASPGPGRATFKPPQTRREIARELSDAGVSAAAKGDFDLARSKWVKAAEADKSWSVPFFNLAMLALDGGDPREAADFIELADIRARQGTSSGDAKVLKQLPALRSRLEKKEVTS